MNKTMKTIVVLISIISFCFSIYFFVDKTYARDEKVMLLEKRLDYKIEGDVLSSQQKRLWSFEERFGPDPDKVPNPADKQEMKELKEQIGLQKQKLLNFK